MMLDIKCPVCGSTEFWVKEWTKVWTVSLSTVFEQPKMRPRGKCLTCNWRGNLPLEGDIE